MARSFHIAIGIFLLPTLLSAELLKKPPEVPQELNFVRMLDVDSYAEATNRRGLGAQTTWIRTRYLDPDVNAFVGMLMGFSHFNQDLRIKSPDAPDTAGLMWNWGIDLGLQRGKHLWELDLMGTTLSSDLGAGLGISGEHQLGQRLIFYHRTVINLFAGDAILDADQGFYWMWKWAGLSLGYRWFTSQHMDRSGPHAGVVLRFKNPKIPFLFPSMG